MPVARPACCTASTAPAEDARRTRRPDAHTRPRRPRDVWARPCEAQGAAPPCRGRPPHPTTPHPRGPSHPWARPCEAQGAGGACKLSSNFLGTSFASSCAMRPADASPSARSRARARRAQGVHGTAPMAAEARSTALILGSRLAGSYSCPPASYTCSIGGARLGPPSHGSVGQGCEGEAPAGDRQPPRLQDRRCCGTAAPVERPRLSWRQASPSPTIVHH